jgi:hypothetical protein
VRNFKAIHIIQTLGVVACVSVFWAISANNSYLKKFKWEKAILSDSANEATAEELEVDNSIAAPDTSGIDLPLPHDQDGPGSVETSGISLPLPDNVNDQVVYDPETGEYIIQQSIGDFDYRHPTSMTLDEYLDYDISKNISKFWAEKQAEEDEANREPFAPAITVDSDRFRTIFGGDQIEIRPQGSAELTFGVNVSKTENPRIPENQRQISTFDFDQRIQLNVVGNIGTKLQLSTSYNTEATFDFENQMKLEYTGEEDEIIKKIEAGNVSMSLPTSLITGSQSLFGVKLETQFGRLRNTTVFSQQKGERKEIEVEGGAQTQLFDIKADDYEANKHYFLSQYFRDAYNDALSSLPVVNSGVNITRIEVWVVNNQANTEEVRNVLGFTDLGEYPGPLPQDLEDEPGDRYISDGLPIPQLTDGPETSVNPNRYPNNNQNDIYYDMVNNPDVLGFTNANQAIQQMNMGYQQGIHYERVGNARKLNPSEYSYNSRLGFISLQQSLNNAEVLAVAYEYTVNGETYQVGSLSQDGISAPSALVLKMLKSSITSLQSPMWDLMMKNVYNIGAYGVNRENFRLGVWYNNPATGVDMNYIPREPIDGELFLQVLNMDQIDINSQPNPDGVFDFVDNAATTGGTINSENGRVYFPVVEPFGNWLREIFEEGNDNPENVINSVVFEPLYDSTKTAAQQIPSLNRFSIKGEFQSSSSSEIPLDAFNIPEGSVTVTAGGVQLVEGQDFTVDYNLGRVKILNEGLLDSGTPIKISLESNSLFNIQTKTMIGSRFDYTVNDDLNVGATILNLRERPLTQKVNIGDEPVNNTILGSDVSYQRESDFLTKMVDKIPFIDTKATSSIDANAEAAYFIPGHSRAIGRDGNSYLDDFEGSQSSIDVRSVNQWFLASTPKGQPELFPESTYEDSLIYNYNRAKMSWYIIDPLFYRDNSLTPPNVDNEMQSDHRMREVLQNEVFPNRQLPTGTPPNIPTLDMSYYPSERGQYNYDRPGGTNETAGLNTDGTLADPESRWGGIQRPLTTTDFESSNVTFIQFWVMDPFNSDSENLNGGDLYINLGNVSEDILNDSQLSFENGYATPEQDYPVLESVWGFYPDPSTFNVVSAFDNTSGTYVQQDIGLDGLNSNNQNLISTSESEFFGDWLTEVQNFSQDAYNNYVQDPSADDYAYYRSTAADNAQLNVLERYKQYNGYEGNSNTANPDGYPIAATTIPNTEDINQDLTLSTIESYYQYKVSMRPQDMGEGSIGENYITDSFETTVTTQDNQNRTVRWYQFQVPIRDFEKRVGQINDFRSIRFMRMFMKGWSEPVTLRFAQLELVRSEWRAYQDDLREPQEVEPTDPEPTSFNIAAVNIEQNGNRDPIPYVVPPGIQREIDVATANQRSLNEQSMALEVCNLADGDARAAYRNINFDMRMYKKLKMFVHAEAAGAVEDLEDDDISVFVRLGSDFNENYYEYEIPLEVTPWGTADDEQIWPEANDVEVEFEQLQNLKISRPQQYPTTQEFSELNGKARLTVKGNPNLANVVTVMVGIRNPQLENNPFSSDDGLSKCGIVWVNELRLTDFNQEGGWAAQANVNAKLADFANVALAANISTPGWGSLEQTVQDRQQETIKGFNASGTFQLGKFFPEEAGIQIPMYVGYSEQVSNPRFDPLSPDIEFDDQRNLTGDERSERLKISQEFTKRRSINFTNVRIGNPGGGGGGGGAGGSRGGLGGGRGGAGGGAGGGGGNESHFYDISNFTLSYGYNEEFYRDVNTAFRLTKNYTGALGYNFSNRPTEVKPFANIDFIKKSKLLKFVKDFNFYTGVKQIGFRNEMDRLYETQRIRNNTEYLFGTETDVLINTQVLKSWNWRRQYNVKYDLTNSISFDFNANNQSLIGEPQGVINRDDRDSYEAYRDSVMNSIKSFGETTSYNHSARLNYKLPLDKFPLLDFLGADVAYTASYQWQRAPFSQDTLGNTIQNSRNLSLNAQANMNTLYNKWQFLKDINTGQRNKKDKKSEDEVSNQDKDGFGNVEDEEEDKISIDPVQEFFRLLMSVKTLSGTYSRNEGLLLPGYGRSTTVLGMDDSFNAPGIGFIAGQQNTNIWGEEVRNFALEAGRNGWLVEQEFLNTQYSETYNESLNLRASLEPIKYLKIDLDANQTTTKGLTSFFRYDPDTDEYLFDSPQETGSFSSSIITWATAFEEQPDNNISAAFEAMLDNRRLVSQRLNSVYHNFGSDSLQNNGFYSGWGPTSQNVVIPAFLAAYTGRDVNDVALSPFQSKMMPNWRVTYNGLTKIEGIKKFFKNFSLNHSYRSTMTTSYVTNLNYEENGQGNPTAFDQSANFPNYIPERVISTVTISEQFSPLIGVDMTIKTANNNNPQLRVEYKKDRTLALSLSNNQVTENRGNALVIGIGYTIPEIPNPFVKRNRKSRLGVEMLENSPLNLRADLTIRDNLTVIRKMEERQNQVTAGQKIISIKTSADLSVSNKLTIRVFYDQQLTRPKISTSFPTSNINSGVALRFTLSQ